LDEEDEFDERERSAMECGARSRRWEGRRSCLRSRSRHAAEDGAAAEPEMDAIGAGAVATGRTRSAQGLTRT
jgi:hypothetical protein